MASAASTNVKPLILAGSKDVKASSTGAAVAASAGTAAAPVPIATLPRPKQHPYHHLLKQKKGMLIVIEGLSKSGRTTQAQALFTRLKQQGIQTNVLSLPYYSCATGALLAPVLRGTIPLSPEACHALLMANRLEMHQVIKEMLCSGTTVILDGYKYSSAAYSMAQSSDSKWCRVLEPDPFKPDLIFGLHVPVETCVMRDVFIETEEQEAGALEFQKNAQEHLFKMDVAWELVGGTLPEVDVHEMIYNRVRKTLAKRLLS
jgi:dTMP kinase